MDLCFLIYWLHVINVLRVTLKLEHCILFILVCILTLEVSCILFITKWDYSFGTRCVFCLNDKHVHILCFVSLRIFLLSAFPASRQPW